MFPIDRYVMDEIVFGRSFKEKENKWKTQHCPQMNRFFRFCLCMPT